MRHPTTEMITNHNDEVSERAKASTGSATAATVFSSGPEAIILGLDVAKARHVVARYVAGEGVKPAEGMTEATLLARGALRRKAVSAL